MWRIMETCDGHSGYEFPWSMFRLLPFSGSSDFHDFHHSKNAGNYSSFFTYLDTLFHTDKEYRKLKEFKTKKVNPTYLIICIINLFPIFFSIEN